MVLVNNKRKKRAMSKGNGGDSDFQKRAGLGRSLYRPYNLNFLPGLGACCKPDGTVDPDKALKEAVARYNTLVARIKEMKAAHDAPRNATGNVKENDGEFKEKDYVRPVLTVKDMDDGDVTIAEFLVGDKAALATAHDNAIDAIEAFRLALTKAKAVDTKNKFTENAETKITL
tara:strand:- start:3370 stop:3888 length:519 start_codon:yes stop_codon:yes gene_type:complete